MLKQHLIYCQLINSGRCLMAKSKISLRHIVPIAKNIKKKKIKMILDKENLFLYITKFNFFANNRFYYI